jgi:hypothetical protein
VRKIVVTVGLAIAVVAVAFPGVASPRPARSGKFVGTYAGKVTEKVSGQKVTAATRGAGKATLVGKGTIAGTVVATTSADSSCAPFGGPGRISGKKGTLKVKVLPTSRGCAASEDERNNISVAGTVKVTGGKGKFKKARGNLHFSGHYDRSSGAFRVKLTGKVRY